MAFARGTPAALSPEEQMKRHWPIVAVSVLSLMTIDAAYAGAKKHRRHVARAPVAVESSFAPARMIEVRPGVIISSYDCLIDEGYGRYRRCSDGKK
jgi:hypothetical protein